MSAGLVRYFGKGRIAGEWVFFSSFNPEPANGDVILELPGSLSEQEAERVRKAITRQYEAGRLQVAEEVYDAASSIIFRGGRPE